MFAAMAAVFTAALTIPQAFTDKPSGLPGPLLMAGCYLVVRGLHLLPYLGLSSNVVFALQVGCWLAALTVEYAAGYLLTTWGWAVRAANHWVERFELILMIALAELIVSVGVGSDLIARPVTWPAGGGATFAVAVAAALWWSHFDLVAPAALQAFHATLFFVAQVGFQARMLGTVTVTRVAVVGVLVGLVPVAARAPALAGTALLAVVCVGLVLAELVLLRKSRRRLREASMHERLTHEARESAWRQRRYHRPAGAGPVSGGQRRRAPPAARTVGPGRPGRRRAASAAA